MAQRKGTGPVVGGWWGGTGARVDREWVGAGSRVDSSRVDMRVGACEWALVIKRGRG